MKRAVILIVLVLLADQALKFWVKLNFYYDSAIPLFGDWAFLHFIENRGMAFGMEFGGRWGKLLLTLFRIAAVGGIGYALWQMVRSGTNRALQISVALIFAGALGNIIDSTFYGVLFSQSTFNTKAVLFPEGGGYAPLFHGAVVDMFYFPVWEGQLPQWLPRWGGEYFIFFRPVFNIADAAITVGVLLFILLQRKGGHGAQEPQHAQPEGEVPQPEAELPQAGTPTTNA